MPKWECLFRSKNFDRGSHLKKAPKGKKKNFDDTERDQKADWTPKELKPLITPNISLNNICSLRKPVFLDC